MKRRYSTLTIIIPTLNEHRNVSKLVTAILGNYPGVSIIVADDGSIDGTRKDVRRIASRNPKVRLLDRSSKETHGLTASVMDAATKVRTQNTIVMDGDMQHPYEKIPNILSDLAYYPLVVGVRTHVRNWGLHRRLISKAMELISIAVFKLRGKPTCGDMMSGFFGIKSTLFKRIISRHGDAFVPRGYKVLLDVLRNVDGEIRVGEMPYSTFHPRIYGKSKLGLKHVGDTLRSTFG